MTSHAFGLTLSVLLLGLLSACANPALKEAERLSQAGQHEAALQRLQQAARQAPDDAELSNAAVKQKDTTVAHLLYQADLARIGGRPDEIQAVLVRLDAAAPGHPRALWLRQDLARKDRVTRLLQEAQAAQGKADWARAESALRSVMAEDPGHAQARQMLSQIDEARQAQTRQQSSLQLKTASKPITLEFREAPLRSVFESLARAAEVNFVFDKDVRGDARVTVFLRNTTVDEAMRVILNTQQLGIKLLNDNTVLVFPNTSQKQRELLDTVTRSFYLVNAEPKQVQTLIRTVAKSRDIFVDERLNMLVVRDTPDVMRLIERLVAGVDLPDPEVMLEVEVMEVSSSRIVDLGLSLPSEVAYGVPGSTLPITTDSVLRASVANPLAIARLKSSVDASNLLANPKIRARNREKAKILLGEKVPVFTTTSTANVGVSSSVSYLDVGLKMEIEPQVQLDDEVIIKVALEVSTITSTVKGPQESTAYQIGTRQATTSLRLRDGETQILAGLINDTESKSGVGLPYINELPIVGRLFGSRNDTHKKTEVVLLITPRVVRNINQSALPVAAMPSGTDAQPGAAPWMVRTGQVSAAASGGRTAVVAGRAAITGRAGAPAAETSILSGPEQVLAGSSFQVTVRNPTDAPRTVNVVFDAALLSVPDGKGGAGQVAVSLPPRGAQVITFQLKAGVTAGQTTVSADSGDAIHLQIQDPSALASERPGDPANGDDEAP